MGTVRKHGFTPLLFLPLFYGTIVAASFFFGRLRIYTGSLWPTSIAHSAHNAAWGTLGALTVTSSPVLVNIYLLGDYGILILVGVVIGVIWVGRMLRRGMNQAKEAGAVILEVPPKSRSRSVPLFTGVRRIAFSRKPDKKDQELAHLGVTVLLLG